MSGKMSLTTKLWLGFGTVLTALVGMAGVSYENTLRIFEVNKRGFDNLEKAKLSAVMNAALQKQTAAVRGFLLAGREDLLKDDDDNRRQFNEAADRVQGMLLTEHGKMLFAEVRKTSGAFRTILDSEIALRRAGRSQEAERLAFTPETARVQTEVSQALAALDAWQNKRAGEAMEESRQREQQTRRLALAGVLIGCALGIVTTISIVRSITRATRQMVTVIQQIALNNLAIADVEVLSNDELGQAGIALNEMKHKLSSVVQAISDAAQRVASSSEEISASATQTAESSKIQSDQTMQAATAMREMSSTVEQISDNSQKAADSSRQAADAARQGGEVVEATLSSMRNIADASSKTAAKVAELGKGSQEIGKIIAVIDDIADQTNLLGLNAAIEAARAGERGRGFAVVADEVRKLAERTTKATKEIATMIESIQSETSNAVQAMEQGSREVQVGMEKTSASGGALAEIIKLSEQVGDMVTQIATAVTEQSATTEQINASVSQISGATQEASAAAEQTAKACADLSSLAFELQTLVSRFKLDSGSHRTDVHSGNATGPANPKAVGAAAGAR